MPACQLEGQAPMAIPPGSDTPVACTAQWQVEGVQFKAIPLPFTTLVNSVPEVDGIPATADNSRNLLAHWCFGTAQLANLGADPFNFDQAYRGLDQLAATDLTPGDLPLCVFYWDVSAAAAPAISFVDNWSVRRRLTRPDAPDPTLSWNAAVADQRSADGEARFLQFQDQILDLVSAGVSRATVASDVFGLLPPVGFLPVALDASAADIAQIQPVADRTTASPGAAAAVRTPDILSPVVINFLRTELSQLGPQSGFVPSTFFGGQAYFFGGLLTWDIVNFALRQSYIVQPIPTMQPQSSSAAAGAASARTVPFTGSVPVPRPTPFPVLRPSPRVIPERGPTATAGFSQVVIYYYVVENYIAVYNALNGTGPPLTPYLVFMKNQLWLPDTRVPFGQAHFASPGFTVQAEGFNTYTGDL